MASIDKFYTRNKEKARQLISFITNAGRVHIGSLNGTDYYLTPANYLYIREDEIDQYDWTTEHPLWNSPYAMDKWLWENCKDQDVLDDIKWKYGIEDSMTKEEIANKFFVIPDVQFGTHFSILKKCPQCLRRTGKELWFIDVHYTSDNERSRYWFYNEDDDMFVPYCIPWTSSTMMTERKLINERSIKRFVRKYRLPVGSEVHFYGKYVGQEWIIKIKK